MLFDDQRRFLDVHLLHDFGEVRVATEGAAAAGAGVKRVFLEVADLFGRERLTLVLGVAGLAADGAWGAIGQRRRLGFDDVGGGGLGRSRGVLARRRELLAQAGRFGARGIESGLQGVQLRGSRDRQELHTGAPDSVRPAIRRYRPQTPQAALRARL